MYTYGFKFRYVCNYRSVSYRVSCSAFKIANSTLNPVEGSRCSISEESIVAFDKLFSRSLKLTFTDVVNADDSELTVICYPCLEDVLLLHEIVSVHKGGKKSYLVYLRIESDEHLRYFESLRDVKSFLMHLNLAEAELEEKLYG